MPTSARLARVALFVSCALLSAAPALAQAAPNISSASSADSPMLVAILVVFCTTVIGLLAHTAWRMARLD